MEEERNEGCETVEGLLKDKNESSEPVRLVPEGFTEEETLPSIPLEDFEDDDDVWVIDIPITIDPKTLIGKQLDFRHDTSFAIDEGNSEKCISVPTPEHSSIMCLLSSQHENSRKIVALDSAGKISINMTYDMPKWGIVIPERCESVQLPQGLQVRHPFLGSKYRDVNLMEDIKEKTVENDACALPDELVINNKSEKPINGCIPNGVDPRKEVVTDTSENGNVLNIKKEVLTPKKSKKRKHESLYLEEVEDSPLCMQRLVKRLKMETSEVTEMESQDVELGNVLEGGSVGKKKKRRKDKKRASEIIIGELTAEVKEEEVASSVDASGFTPKKKKIKKEKRDDMMSGEEITTGVSQEELVILADDGMETPKKTKKKKKRDSEYVSEVTRSDASSKEIVVMDETSGTTEMEPHEVEIMLKQAEDGHVKRKSKKDKRTSEIVRGENAVVVKEEEVDTSLDAPGQIPKKKKIKKEKRDHVMSGEERETDVSQEELLPVSLDCGGETPRKLKKKKERGSEYGSEGRGGDVAPEVVVIDDEISDQTSERVKKIKKEIKREHDGPTISLIQEREFDGIQSVVQNDCKKSKRRHTVHDVGMAAVIVDPNSVMTEREVEVVTEMESQDVELGNVLEGGSVGKKKRRKDKKRASEIIIGELTAEVKEEEVASSVDASGFTPKKKKIKKEKRDDMMSGEEITTGVSQEELVILADDGMETPKKTKKKKKRDSEYVSEVTRSDASSKEIVIMDETPDQTPVKTKKIKKKRSWYIDHCPATDTSHSVNSVVHDGSHNNKINMEHNTAQVLGLPHEKGDGAKQLHSKSKSSKRRHAGHSMYTAADTHMDSMKNMEIEGKSSNLKKERNTFVLGLETQLLSQKKEKKIKRESTWY